MKLEYTFWEDDGVLLGYLNEFPDYWTQGENPDDLKEHLRDLYRELTSGTIPGVRRIGELEVA